MQHTMVSPHAVRLLAAAGFVAAVPAVAVSPDTPGQSHSAIPVALTNVDVSGAELFLSNPPSDMIPGSFASTADRELSGVYSDAPLVFHVSPTGLATLDWDKLVGLMTVGQLSATTLPNATNFVSPTGDYIPATTSTADVNVADDTTATQLFIGALNEANIETASLHNVQGLVLAQYSPASLGVTDEIGVTGDLWAFQEDINGSLNALNNALDPTSLGAYDSNDFLVALLHGLLVSETNMNDLAGGILTGMSADEAPILAAVDAGLLTNALGEYLYAQGIIGFFSFENTLDDIGNWFSSL